MSNKPYKGFEPKWLLTPAPAGSYRSIFRWGDPEFFKYPKESLYKMMKEAFHMTDEDFRDYTDDIGFDRVELPDHPSEMAPEHLQALKKIVGEEFVTTGDYERLSVAYGCTGYDLLRLRHKQIDSLPDVVVYPDTTEQVEELVHYAAGHKLPLYVYGGGSSVTRGVEPIKGGTLASLPADAAAPLHALRPDATDASWALRWVGSHKNVHVILSGMSAENQLTDNLATFGHFEPLSPAENAAVESVANELHRRIKIGCTGCRYCMPCPMGVDIPDNFSIWNKLGMFGQKDAIKAQWTTCFPDSEKALHCVRCGKCEAVCPQKLPIRDSLAQLQKELDAL